MKKVASLVFNPFVNDSRVLKESISLANNGYSVEVIAHLNKGLKDEEKRQNFIVRRFSYLDRTKTKGVLGKLNAYLSYVSKSVSHCKFFDYLHCNDLNTLPIGVIIKLFYNKQVKIVYDAHEYETEIHGLSGFKKKATCYLERKLIKYADKVITVSNAIANCYTEMYDIEKPALVLNTPPYQGIEKHNLFREELGIGTHKTIYLYQGGLSTGRGIEILLETFKRIKNKDSVIVFMGYGPLEKLVKKFVQKYENIYFKEAVTPEVLLKYTSSADYGISMIEDSCLSYRYCLPNKIFEYVMAGLPILVSNLYEMKKLVKKYNIGVVSKENTVQGLLEAVEMFNELDKVELSKNIEKVKEIYNWEQQEKVLVELYKNL